MTDFEKAVSETQEDMEPQRYQYDYENVIEFTRDAKVATVTFCQGRMVSRIKKLKKKFPDDVEITSEKKRTIVAHIPAKWIKINPPQQREAREYTDEELKELCERLAKARESRLSESEV